MLELVRVFSAGKELEGEGNPLFGLVNNAKIDPAGGILVLDARPPALHRYAANGAWLGQIGREGQEPGEYRQPSDVAVLEDGRIVLWDPGLARLTVYSADGQPETSHRLPNAMLSATRSMLTDRNGNVYVTAPDMQDGLANPVLVKVDLHTMKQDTVRSPWPSQNIPNLMPLNAEIPFWPTDVSTVLSSGEIVASHRAS